MIFITYTYLYNLYVFTQVTTVVWLTILSTYYLGKKYIIHFWTTSQTKKLLNWHTLRGKMRHMFQKKSFITPLMRIICYRCVYGIYFVFKFEYHLVVSNFTIIRYSSKTNENLYLIILQNFKYINYYSYIYVYPFIHWIIDIDSLK